MVFTFVYIRSLTSYSAKMDYKSSITPGFCPDCGSILPLLRMTGGVSCYSCHKAYDESVYGTMEVNYKIHFNSYESRKAEKQQGSQKTAAAAEGPVVSRKCPKCDNDKMSYATVQLRSADEGQTVFFTCTKCQFKESENS
nr:DNA-directed RNA polymerase I subunit RPA12-like [Aedes albopictus]